MLSNGRRPRRPEAEERWNEIIEAAGSIIFRKGYEAASLQEIASSVGLFKGSVYYYIHSKEDLLFEIVSRALDRVQSTIEEDPELAARPAPVRLRMFVHRWMSLTTQAQEWNIVAEREFMQLSARNLRAVIARRDELAEFLKGILRAGIEEGCFDPGTDISVASSAIFEIMRNNQIWHRPGGRLSRDDLSAWYAEFAIRGLGGPQWQPVEGLADRPLVDAPG